MQGDFDGEKGFADVEQERGDAEAFGSAAGNVGGADVAAAGCADVLVAKDFYEQVAEGNGPKQIGERNGEEPGVHCRPMSLASVGEDVANWCGCAGCAVWARGCGGGSFRGRAGWPTSGSFAVAGEVELVDLGVLGVGEADVDEADGLVGVGAGAPGPGPAMPVMEMPREAPVRARMPSARARATSGETGPLLRRVPRGRRRSWF